MRSTQTLTRCFAAFLCAAGVANASYVIEDTYDHTNFFTEFNFFSGADPTGGDVSYVSALVANQTGLAGYSNNAVYLGVDHTTMNPTAGRASTRVTSNKAYTHGLFIADVTHMPGAECGVWPAFWTFGPNWPSSGEIDIIEGVNAATTDTISLHTSAGCTVQNTGSSLSSTNCNAGNGDDGCSASTTTANAYGAGFNAIGGGVYAMEWTSTAISIWFFPRTAIPADITSGKPAPSGWGAAPVSFTGSGCDIDQHFMNHNIVFDTTFCGQWAGQTSVWDGNSVCSALASTCDAYVAANPTAFTTAYWLVNSVKVYQDATLSTKRGMASTPFRA
jgi:hypothetical protein